MPIQPIDITPIRLIPIRPRPLERIAANHRKTNRKLRDILDGLIGAFEVLVVEFRHYGHEVELVCGVLEEEAREPIEALVELDAVGRARRFQEGAVAHVLGEAVASVELV